MTAFWDVALCSLVGVEWRFRDVYCLRHRGDEGSMMEAVRTSETSADFHETAQRYIPESGRHILCRLNLKYHITVHFVCNVK
jgi:hypothetical protein